MKHLIFLSLATLTLFSSANAEVITPDVALQRALAPSSARRAKSLNNNVQLIKTIDSDGLPSLYLFNNKKIDGGFLIVSADDKIVPILGYSDSSSIKVDSIPDGLAYWLESLSQQIEFSRNHHSASTFVAKERPQRDPIAPLCKTTWDQDAPYNDLCPKIGTTDTYTGCVATATSQAMKYHQWPTQGSGKISYTWQSEILSEDFSSVTFDWNNMLNDYQPGSYTQAQGEAVAQLMKSVGYSVYMNYGTGASGAGSVYVAGALGNFFGYDKSSLSFKLRDYYSLYDWESIVYNSLVNDGPIVYNGQSLQGGHSFICDGYSSDGFFHFNWGWGGISDGYFLLNALNPDSQGIGGYNSGMSFDFKQDIICGIRPDLDGSSQWGTPNLYSSSMLAASFTSGNFTFAGTVTGEGIFNYGPSSLPSGWRIAYKLQPVGGGEPIWGIRSYPTSLAILKGYTSIAIPLTEFLDDGKYMLTLLYSGGSQDEWHSVLTPLGTPNQWVVNVEGSVFTVNAIAPGYLVGSDMSVSPMYLKSNYKVKAKITNPSSQPYHGSINGMLCNANNKIQALGLAMIVDFDPHETREIEYISQFALLPQGSGGLTAGDYKFCLATESSNGYQPITEFIEVEMLEPEDATMQVTDLSIPDMQRKESLTANFSVTCNDGYYSRSLYMLIFPETGGDNLISGQSPIIFIGKGETQKVSITMNFDNGVDGATYMAAIFSLGTNGKAKQISAPVKFTLGSGNSGISDIIIDNGWGDSAIYFNMQGIKVDNPVKGNIYLRRQGNKIDKIIF